MKPGKYIWKSKDVDFPVTVVESVGIFDGREYVKITESTSAIPADELQPVQVSKVRTSRKPPSKRLF